MADPVPLLLVAAALSRTLADVLDQLEQPVVDESARAAVSELADQLEQAVRSLAAE